MCPSWGRPTTLADGGGGVTGWETSERVLESSGFESRQRVLVAEPVVEASEAGARTLGVTYWQAVNHFTRGGVRASWTGGGGKLKLLGGADAAHVRAAGAVVRRRSRQRAGTRSSGGLLALRAGGSVTLAQRPEGRAAGAERHRRGVPAAACRARRRAALDRDALREGAEPLPRRGQPSLLRAAPPEPGLVNVTVFGATGVVGRALAAPAGRARADGGLPFAT